MGYGKPTLDVKLYSLSGGINGGKKTFQPYLVWLHKVQMSFSVDFCNQVLSEGTHY